MTDAILPMASFTLTGQLVNTTVTTVYLNNDLRMNLRPHCMIGVRFTDSAGATATPGAGTYTVTVETMNNPGVFQSIENGTTVDATAALGTLDFLGNATRVRVVSTGITTATHFDITLTSNVS